MGSFDHSPTTADELSVPFIRKGRAEPISPEHQERALLDGGGMARDLAILARLQRERDRCEAAMGTVWYERWRAWLVWAPYLILGKLETVAWDLRRR